MSEKVVSLHGTFIPTCDKPNPHVIEQIERMLSLAQAGEIAGIQAVTIDGNACAGLIRAGSVTYSMVGMLHCAAHEAIQAIQAME